VLGGLLLYTLDGFFSFPVLFLFVEYPTVSCGVFDEEE